MSSLKEAVSFIKGNDPFIIAAHISPDGDAIGSAVALSLAFDQMGKKSIIFDRDSVPEFYRFMPGCQRITNNLSGIKTEDYSLVLLDCNDPERAGIEKFGFKNALVVDHHGTETSDVGIRWIEPSEPATGVMIYKLLKEFGIIITKDIAVNIYTAIAVDTGTFRYNNTTAEAFKIAGELLEAGAVPGEIAENLYETWSQGRFRLLVMTLDTVEIQGPFAIITVTKEMHKQTGTSSEDTENLTGFPRMMKDIVMSALFKETDKDYYKISLRSKGNFDVARIAQGFGGGGHVNAAGYRIKKDLKTAKELLLKTAFETFNRLNK